MNVIHAAPRPLVARKPDPLEPPSIDSRGQQAPSPLEPDPSGYPYETFPETTNPLDTHWGFGCFENHFNQMLEQAVAEKWRDQQNPLPPLLFKSLIAAESAFDPVAISRTGAAGLTQLTRGTAQAFGLSLTPIDERMVPAKALNVGVAVLDEKYTVLNNPPLGTDWGSKVAESYEKYGRPSGQAMWQLALAGYNGGASTVMRAMARAYDAGVDPTSFANLVGDRSQPESSFLYQSVKEIYGEHSALSKYREMANYPGRVLGYMDRAEHPLQGLKIVVDPGHGGRDSGAIGPTGKQEKDCTLGISLKLTEKLRGLGAEVRMTRETDRTVGPPDGSHRDELQARVEFANSWPSNLFVSVHCNSNESPSAHGTEVYIARGASRASQEMAREIHRDMVDQTGLRGRGVSRADFYVIKNTTMPAVLIETAFISNPTEEALLADSNFQQRTADSIASGLVKFHHAASQECCEPA